jgi:hypothetical protein
MHSDLAWQDNAIAGVRIAGRREPGSARDFIIYPGGVFHASAQQKALQIKRIDWLAV